MNVRTLGEERLVAHVTTHLPLNSNVFSGAGDDCAIVALPRSDDLLVLKTDCVVEGVHFTSRAPAAAVGWKAMARPLSDFAAVSGVPQFALITLIISPRKSVRWVERLYQGLVDAARRFGVGIVGGETSTTTGMTVISVSVAGLVEKDRWVGRSGGEVGDQLYVTGRLGGSLGGRHLRFTPRIAESRWLTRRVPVHAMMDLSDGLGADLPRLARASGVGFQVEENALPRHRGCTIKEAISDGEDFELLFAIAPENCAELEKGWRRRWSLPLTRIGQFIAAGKSRQKLPRGYMHFA